MFGLSKVERDTKKLRRFIESLTPEQIYRLRAYLKDHCIHGVSHDSIIPCNQCWHESIYYGDITKILPWID